MDSGGRPKNLFPLQRELDARPPHFWPPLCELDAAEEEEVEPALQKYEQLLDDFSRGPEQALFALAGVPQGPRARSTSSRR